MFKIISYIGYLVLAFALYTLITEKGKNTDFKEAKSTYLVLYAFWLLVPNSVYDTINLFKDFRLGITSIGNDIRCTIPIFGAIFWTYIVYIK